MRKFVTSLFLIAFLLASDRAASRFCIPMVRTIYVELPNQSKEFRLPPGRQAEAAG
jgi:hypothetical protein